MGEFIFALKFILLCVHDSLCLPPVQLHSTMDRNQGVSTGSGLDVLGLPASGDSNATGRSLWQDPAPLPEAPTVEDLRLSLDFAHHNIELLREQHKHLSHKQASQSRSLADLQQSYADLFDYTHDLEEYVLSIDVNIRKKNLIVSGIAESPNETSQSLISSLHEIFVEYIDTLEEDDFDLAFRLGLVVKNQKNPRPILVKVHKESVRNSIIQMKYDEDDESAYKNMFVNDDLPKIMSERKALM